MTTTPTGGRVTHSRTGDALELSMLEVQLLARATAGGVDANALELKQVFRKLANLGLLVPAPRVPAAVPTAPPPLADPAAPRSERPGPVTPRPDEPVPAFRAELRVESASAPGMYEIFDDAAVKSLAMHDFELSLARMLDGRQTHAAVVEAGQRLGIPVDLSSLGQFLRQLGAYGFLASPGTATAAGPPRPARKEWDPNTRYLFQSGMRLNREGRYLEASAFLETIVAADAENAEAVEALAQVRQRLDAAKEAEAAAAAERREATLTSPTWLAPPEAGFIPPVQAPAPVKTGAVRAEKRTVASPAGYAVAVPPVNPQLTPPGLSLKPRAKAAAKKPAVPVPPEDLPEDPFANFAPRDASAATEQRTTAKAGPKAASAKPAPTAPRPAAASAPPPTAATPAPALQPEVVEPPPPRKTPQTAGTNESSAEARPPALNAPQLPAIAAEPQGASSPPALEPPPVVTKVADGKSAALPRVAPAEPAPPQTARPPPPPADAADDAPEPKVLLRARKPSAPAPPPWLPPGARMTPSHLPPRPPERSPWKVGATVLTIGGAIALGWMLGYSSARRPAPAAAAPSFAPPAAAWAPALDASVVADPLPNPFDDAGDLAELQDSGTTVLASTSAPPDKPDAGLRPRPINAAPVWTEAKVSRVGRVTMGEIIATGSGTVSWKVRRQEAVKRGQVVGSLTTASGPGELVAPKAGLLMPSVAEGAPVAGGALVATIVYFEAYVQAVLNEGRPQPTWTCEVFDGATGLKAPCKLVTLTPRGTGFTLTATTEPLWFDSCPDPRLHLSPW